MYFIRALQALVGLALIILESINASPVAQVMDQRQSSTFTNPIRWEDMPDADVFRIGDVFYYSSSTFAYSPGAPLYKSYDLVNWAPVTHSVPRLDFGDKYDLGDSSRAYVQGIWASTLRYRESTDTFYWIGCIEFSKTYIYTSPGSGAGANNGEVASWDWQQAGVIDTCYYDCGLLIDDDDTMYVAYGNTNISVAQLSSDGLSEVKTQGVLSGGDVISKAVTCTRSTAITGSSPPRLPPGNGRTVLRALGALTSNTNSSTTSPPRWLKPGGHIKEAW